MSSRLYSSRLLAAILAICVALGPGISATPRIAQQRQDNRGDKPLKIQTDLVAVDAAVTDKDGNFVRNLTREDFVIYEDGQPQKLDFFEANEESDLTRPLAAVFALDISGSIKPEEIRKQREAAESFVKLVRRDSLFAILTFNYEIRVLQDFTSDPKKVSDSFRRIGRTGGSTRLFQSIDKAISMLKHGPAFIGGRRLRRVVVVITDGYDSVDTIDQHELIRRANNEGVTVYSITIPSYAPSIGDRGKQRAITLLDAAEIVPRTGGADFSADADDFTPALKAIAEEVKSSYTLAYYPPDRTRHDGHSHQIRVEVKRSGLTVRASRQSYLARAGG
jgi:Ca-activated chloride channel family protein